MRCLLSIIFYYLLFSISQATEISIISVETRSNAADAELIDSVRDGSRLANLDGLTANNLITVRLKCSSNESIALDYYMINHSRNDTVIDSTKAQQSVCLTTVQPDSITIKVPDIVHDPDDKYQLIIRNNSQILVESKPFIISPLVSLDVRNEYIDTWLSPTANSVFMNDGKVTASFSLKQPFPKAYKLIVKLTREMAFAADRIMEISAAELQSLTRFDGSKSIITFIYSLNDNASRKYLPAYYGYKFKIFMKRDGDANTDSIVEGIKSLVSFAIDISDSPQFKIINSAKAVNASSAATMNTVAMIARIPIISNFTIPH